MCQNRKNTTQNRFYLPSQSDVPIVWNRLFCFFISNYTNFQDANKFGIFWFLLQICSKFYKSQHKNHFNTVQSIVLNLLRSINSWNWSWREKTSRKCVSEFVFCMFYLFLYVEIEKCQASSVKQRQHETSSLPSNGWWAETFAGMNKQNVLNIWILCVSFVRNFVTHKIKSWFDSHVIHLSEAIKWLIMALFKCW